MISIIIFVFLDQNQSTFVLPRMSSSPTKNISSPAHLLRQRKLALMTWMIVMLHGYKFSMENELAWVSTLELFCTFRVRECVLYSTVSDVLCLVQYCIRCVMSCTVLYQMCYVLYSTVSDVSCTVLYQMCLVQYCVRSVMSCTVLY